ncbi:MAG: tRNA 2-thiouridine(34) synthase MnmA [Steroidobacteraceae bacterium]
MAGMSSPLPHPDSSKLVIVSMSGGVDSSVAAARLLEQGYRVEGLYMSNWEEDEDGYCTSAADYQDALKVSRQLGIPLHKTSFAAEYRQRVFQHFLDEYAAGRTPNPDVLCNREIKFGACFEHAMRLGADCVATGHYARVAHDEHGPRLLKSLDLAKDQSYFLHAVPASALAKTLFPVGDLNKDEVRRIAQSLALPVHDKKDSTGICFIGERPFAEFLAGYLPGQPGDIETVDGKRLGTHRGLMFYTLGQRQGLLIGGQRGATTDPWYVAAKDLKRNVLVVTQGRDHPALLSQSLAAAEMSWIGGHPPAARFRSQAKTRYRQPDQGAVVEMTGTDTCAVTFDMPQRAVTPGQYVVLYSGDTCLGGGVIDSTRPAEPMAHSA